MKKILLSLNMLVRTKPFFAIGIFSVAAFLLGGIFFAGFWRGDRENTIRKNMPDRQKNAKFKFTSPLLDCNYSGGPFSLRADSMKQEIEETIGQEIENNSLEHVSVYFRDLNNGPTMGINENEKFTPASLLKVPLMIAYLKKAEEEPNILKKKIVFSGQTESSTGQNFIPSMKIEKGTEYELEDLIKRMIVYSDNSASQLLLADMEGDFLENVYKDLGIEVPGKSGQENFMTVKDYAAFFRILYNSSYLDREMSEKALSFLSQSEYVKGLKTGIPGNVPIAHKFGERTFGGLNQMHNCGIIYHTRSPYLLCVMTRGGSFSELEKTLQAISRKVYEEVDK